MLNPASENSGVVEGFVLRDTIRTIEPSADNPVEHGADGVP
jgi:hypothetical protein